MIKLKLPLRHCYSDKADIPDVKYSLQQFSTLAFNSENISKINVIVGIINITRNEIPGKIFAWTSPTHF